MEIEKTPASLLNELMAKIGIVPVYELSISDSNMFGMKIFDMKVTCDKVTATGSGKSKKEAKHHAAKAMLAKLNKDQVVVESIKESVSPSASLINATVNYVAELKKLSFEYKLEEPVYKDAEAVGPPHSLLHIVQCTVSDKKVEGKGKSKKDARQDAALKMITELKSVCKSSNTAEDGIEKLTTVNTEIAIGLTSNNSIDVFHKESYDMVKKSTDDSLKIKLSSYDMISKLKDLSELVKECQLNFDEKKIAKINEGFHILMESAHIRFEHMLLQTVEPVTFQLTIQLNTVPNILETSLGKTSEEVHLRTIEKVIHSLNKFIA